MLDVMDDILMISKHIHMIDTQVGDMVEARFFGPIKIVKIFLMHSYVSMLC
jgi:hypothetical protein